MMPKEFLRQLPEVRDLMDEECLVCLQKYVPTNAPAPGIVERVLSMAVSRGSDPIHAEHAVRLPCQHVIGSECIKRWISPLKGDQNTCPYCVQQLFTPVKYPVSNKPHWDTLIDLLDGYGFTMDSDGWWFYDQTQGASALSAKDILDAVELAQSNAGFVAAFFNPNEDRRIMVQRIAAARLTVHLREAVLYLQLKSNGADLPAIEEINSEYPYRTLEKQQEDALFDEFERRKVFDHETGSCSRREIWEWSRDLGLVPELNWEDDGYYLSIA